MRIARVNITVPDELLDRARTARLNVSRVAASALGEELDRRERIVALDDYLRDLRDELGPIPAAERAAARDWAEQTLPGGGAAEQSLAGGGA
jgi:hypothetical protein